MGKQKNIKQYPGELPFNKVEDRSDKTTSNLYSRRVQDFSSWYSPMVDRISGLSSKHPDKVLDNYDNSNFVAIVYNGSKVLDWCSKDFRARLSNIQSQEFQLKYLGGIDTVPICLNPGTTEELVQAVLWLECKCGGVILNGLQCPSCFQVIDILREDGNIPVWHQDHQSAAVVNLAGLFNALKIVKKNIKDVKVAMIGISKENLGTLNLMVSAGLSPGNVVICDGEGILLSGRQGIDGAHPLHKYKEITNDECKCGGIPEALQGMDVCLAHFAPGPNLIKPEWVAFMADNPVILACSEPQPEIWPWDAKKMGAKVVATKDANFPNHLDNALVFPGIFRGALDVGASRITDEMCVAAAEGIAEFARDMGITTDYILPTTGDWEMFARIATAVGLKAIEQGFASNQLSQVELYFKAKDMILDARKNLEYLIKREQVSKAA